MMNLDIFTDGSCMKTSKGILCGYGVHYVNNNINNKIKFNDISRIFRKKPLTNQRTELYAIYKGIKRVYKKNKKINLIIYSDSEYSIKSLTLWIKKWKINNWITSNNKPVLNQDIIKKIDKLINNYEGDIKFIHVKAHTDNQNYESINNAIVDELAKQGALKNNIK